MRPAPLVLCLDAPDVDGDLLVRTHVGRALRQAIRRLSHHASDKHPRVPHAADPQPARALPVAQVSAHVPVRRDARRDAGQGRDHPPRRKGLEDFLIQHTLPRRTLDIDDR